MSADDIYQAVTDRMVQALELPRRQYVAAVPGLA